MHINKRTKITDPLASELDFDINAVKSDEDLQTLTTINNIIEHKTKNTKVSVAGCVVFEGSPETMLVLWETDMHPVQNGQTYSLTRALVTTFRTNKYITLNRQSSITQEQITIQRTEEKLLDNQLNTVSCPVDGVEKVTTYLSCKILQKVQCSFSFNC